MSQKLTVEFQYDLPYYVSVPLTLKEGETLEQGIARLLSEEGDTWDWEMAKAGECGTTYVSDIARGHHDNVYDAKQHVPVPEEFTWKVMTKGDYE